MHCPQRTWPRLMEALLLWVLLLAVMPISHAQVVKINRYPLPTQYANPINITAGPDGALWFTDNYYPRIGRITPDGVVTLYHFRDDTDRPDGGGGIVPCSDGALWFVETMGRKIGRITTGGVISEYPFAWGWAEGITCGPDGALWFTSDSGINRFTTAGALTFYPASPAFGITQGPDGALWFAEVDANKIGRITTEGIITEYPVPTPHSALFGIAAGPDGALWFTEWDGGVGRISTTGVITEYPLPAAYVRGITAGPDGALWFTEYNRDVLNLVLGRITTGGVISQYDVPGGLLGYPLGIATGPDGSLWFTDGTNEIGQVVLADTDKTKPHSQVLPLPSTESGSKFTVQWSGTDIGSGVRDYTVYVSDNGGPFTFWQWQTLASQGVFTGLPRHT